MEARFGILTEAIVEVVRMNDGGGFMPEHQPKASLVRIIAGDDGFLTFIQSRQRQLITVGMFSLKLRGAETDVLSRTTDQLTIC